VDYVERPRYGHGLSVACCFHVAFLVGHRRGQLNALLLQNEDVPFDLLVEFLDHLLSRSITLLAARRRQLATPTD
jgi:hypothetical protein